LDYFNIKKKLEACSLSEYPQKAKRPVNCILENKMIKKQGINLMLHWKEDLEHFLTKHGKELLNQVE
jgi:dTDP-4-dehydrorhamnose reductase